MSKWYMNRKSDYIQMYNPLPTQFMKLLIFGKGYRWVLFQTPKVIIKYLQKFPVFFFLYYYYFKE